jgi:hypothetical protein
VRIDFLIAIPLKGVNENHYTNRHACGPGVGDSSRAHVAGQANRRARITPADSELEVRIFLTTLAAGESVREAAKLAGFS